MRVALAALIFVSWLRPPDAPDREGSREHALHAQIQDAAPAAPSAGRIVCPPAPSPRRIEISHLVALAEMFADGGCVEAPVEHHSLRHMRSRMRPDPLHDH